MRHNFKELKVWQNSRELVKKVYVATVEFPNNEQYGLTSQIRRSSISIVSNIAEGSGRGTDKDFSRFLNLSLGSAYELETQLILAYDLELVTKEIFEKISDNINEVQKMLYGLIKSLNK